MKRILKNDNVKVIAGSSKGQSGKVLSVIDNTWVIVEGLNKKKRHLKGNPHLQIESKIVEVEGRIHISNVAHVDPSTGKPAKIGFRFDDANNLKTKIRYFKKSNNAVQA
jgi:large subunit ribosomal protein L24